MLNPTAKIAKSDGIDLPVMNVYLAGRIAGECIDKCSEWRNKIVNHYRNYKPIFDNNDSSGIVIDYESYPIAFINPLGSGEAKSVDPKGLTSAIPPNLIYQKDLLSLEKADVIVANMEDYFEIGIEEELGVKPIMGTDGDIVGTNGYNKSYDYFEGFLKLRHKILNRRENFGTICEFAIALYLQKPIITIVPPQRREIYEKHPFAKRASVIVTSVEELLEKKWLQILYKSMAGQVNS